jgi:two-component sensor histidine kinase
LSPLGRSEVPGSTGGIAAFSIETTQLREQQLALRAAEEDKESLLHELDHRVKNNLQTILSILHIQVDSLSESTSREVLQDAIMRVAALGHLYDASVVTDHVSQIALHTYLGRIVRQSSTARDRGGPAPFTADLEEMYVPMGTAVPLGLLTAELLTGLRKSSALCPEGPGLRIELITAGHTTGRLSVACPATASGVPAGVTHEVVHALADQIGATIRRHGNPDGGEPVRIDVLFPRGEAGSQSGVGVREN